MTSRIPAVSAVDLDDLLADLRASWMRETSSDPTRWSSDNPAWGQCAVTALLVQDRLGGGLLRADVQGLSHYWNRLPNGEELDLTREQFDEGVQVGPGEGREREYVLSFPATAARYALLARRLKALASRRRA